MDKRSFVFITYTLGQLWTFSLGNTAYNHILRINSWTSPENNSNNGDADQRLAAAEAAAADKRSAGMEPDTRKRQVDPLHSCIEAKCSSWNSGNYLDCIYRHCISGFQLHGRRRNVDDGTPNSNSFGQPEGRFLLLPVSAQSTSEPQLPLPDILRPQPGDRTPSTSSHGAHRLSLIASAYNESEFAPSARSKRHIDKRVVAAAARRLKMASTFSPEESNAPTSLVNTVSQKNGLSGVKVTVRRRYYDIEGDCVHKMCGHLQPHTIYHLQCKEQCTSG